ncbi:MAG: winged helix-turn-helix domain-containing protein [Pyrinomonadaceae bacterium]
MSEINNNDKGFSFDRFKMWPSERLLTNGDKIVHLTPRVFDLLEVLVRNSGQVVSKEVLLDTVWAERNVEEGNINRTVSTLRKQLGHQTNGNDFIETVPKFGYRFLSHVSEIEPDASVAVEDNAATEPSRRLKTFPIAALIITVVIAISAFAWLRKSAPTNKLSAEKNVLIRLTNSDIDEGKPEFTADGRIRFTRETSFIMNADGSAAHRDETIPNLRSGIWSPDGTRVMFYKDGETKTAYLANADGSGEIKLPFTFGNCQWSADGKRFLYQSGVRQSDGGVNSNIYIYNLDTGVIDTIVEGPSFDGDPSFAPDGSSILFVSDRDGNLEIYSKDLAAGETKRLTVDPAHDAFPTFAPDGTQILFSSQRDKEDRDVFIMNADGTGVRRVTDLASNEGISNTCWSRDGTQILLLSDASGKFNVYLMNIEPFAPGPIFTDSTDQIRGVKPVPGSDKFVATVERNAESFEFWLMESPGKRIAKIASTNNLSVPNVSPNGSLIVFVNKVDGNSEIFAVSLDGGAPQNISNHPHTDAAPAWSPDGTRIVFVSNRGDNRAAYGIFTMNADGSGVRELYFANSFAHYPTYSPDGKRIIFNDDKIGGKTGNFELFSIDAETGGDEQRLTFRLRYDVQPAISPDGKRIAFTRDAGGNGEIFVMNSDGSGVVRVTRDLADDNYPVWSSDGKQILFTSNRSGKFGIYALSVN